MFLQDHSFRDYTCQCSLVITGMFVHILHFRCQKQSISFLYLGMI